MNVPPTIGMAISADYALVGPLSATLGLEDLYDVLEVVMVDAHNARVAAKRREETS